MIRLILISCAVTKVCCHILPLIYAAPSAVSHQSRIDIRHSPGFVQAPLIYSPAATLFASHQKQIASDTVFTPIFSDTILTPIALSYYHNLPLARALQHPVAIGKVQEECGKKETAVADVNQESAIKESEKQNFVDSVVSKLEPTREKIETLIVEDENYKTVQKAQPIVHQNVSAGKTIHTNI